jgi:hypothetical protein
MVFIRWYGLCYLVWQQPRQKLPKLKEGVTMAGKRFVKPVKAQIAPVTPHREPYDIWLAQDKITREEYRYVLAQTKRQHPDWTLEQRRTYAQNAAQSLFD